MKKTTTPIYDILGISTATLCLIHCILFPLFTLLPFAVFHNEWVDTAFACIGMFVVSKILLSDAPQKVKIILGISILLIITSVVLELLYNVNFGLVYTGGFGMIAGHILNYKSHLKIE